MILFRPPLVRRTFKMRAGLADQIFKRHAFFRNNYLGNFSMVFKENDPVPGGWQTVLLNFALNLRMLKGGFRDGSKIKANVLAFYQLEKYLKQHTGYISHVLRGKDRDLIENLKEIVLLNAAASPVPGIRVQRDNFSAAPFYYTARYDPVKRTESAFPRHATIQEGEHFQQLGAGLYVASPFSEPVERFLRFIAGRKLFLRRAGNAISSFFEAAAAGNDPLRFEISGRTAPTLQAYNRFFVREQRIAGAAAVFSRHERDIMPSRLSFYLTRELSGDSAGQRGGAPGALSSLEIYRQILRLDERAHASLSPAYRVLLGAAPSLLPPSFSLALQASGQRLAGERRGVITAGFSRYERDILPSRLSFYLIRGLSGVSAGQRGGALGALSGLEIYRQILRLSDRLSASLSPAYRIFTGAAPSLLSPSFSLALQASGQRLAGERRGVIAAGLGRYEQDILPSRLSFYLTRGLSGDSAGQRGGAPGALSGLEIYRQILRLDERVHALLSPAYRVLLGAAPTLLPPSFSLALQASGQRLAGERRGGIAVGLGRHERRAMLPSLRFLNLTRELSGDSAGQRGGAPGALSGLEIYHQILRLSDRLSASLSPAYRIFTGAAPSLLSPSFSLALQASGQRLAGERRGGIAVGLGRHERRAMLPSLRFLNLTRGLSGAAAGQRGGALGALSGLEIYHQILRLSDRLSASLSPANRIFTGATPSLLSPSFSLGFQASGQRLAGERRGGIAAGLGRHERRAMLPSLRFLNLSRVPSSAVAHKRSGTRKFFLIDAGFRAHRKPAPVSLPGAQRSGKGTIPPAFQLYSRFYRGYPAAGEAAAGLGRYERRDMLPSLRFLNLTRVPLGVAEDKSSMKVLSAAIENGLCQLFSRSLKVENARLSFLFRSALSLFASPAGRAAGGSVSILQPLAAGGSVAGKWVKEFTNYYRQNSIYSKYSLQVPSRALRKPAVFPGLFRTFVRRYFKEHSFLNKLASSGSAAGYLTAGSLTGREGESPLVTAFASYLPPVQTVMKPRSGDLIPVVLGFPGESDASLLVDAMYRFVLKNTDPAARQVYRKGKTLPGTTLLQGAYVQKGMTMLQNILKTGFFRRGTRVGIKTFPRQNVLQLKKNVSLQTEVAPFNVLSTQTPAGEKIFNLQLLRRPGADHLAGSPFRGKPALSTAGYAWERGEKEINYNYLFQYFPVITLLQNRFNREAGSPGGSGDYGNRKPVQMAVDLDRGEARALNFSSVDIDRIVDRIYRELERRMKFDRQRMGL